MSDGDIVVMKFEVQKVHQGENACNVTLRAIPRVIDTDEYLPVVSCNSKLMERIDDSPRTADS